MTARRLDYTAHNHLHCKLLKNSKTTLDKKKKPKNIYTVRLP